MADDAERYARLQRVFLAARAMDPAARPAFLDAECGADAALRQEVEELLGALEDAREDAFSDTVIGAAREALEDVVSGDSRAAGNRPGDVIDRYQLLECIGEGGMGEVWRAEQREPVRRVVALKVVKLGMDTREVIARFEAERQALALMDHPNIAAILDGGATEAGRPYFVMDHVDGVPLTDWCIREELGLRERLGLFLDVCRAVQHAHQKGVIHRDLKPSNVLVAMQDGAPTPKVIDFGIAKATAASVTPGDLLTREAQILGTPAYMAPEQADRSSLDVDTRADVYSLGVILYELLTGVRPLDDHLDRDLDTLLRRIREVDPRRPSTRGVAANPRASTGVTPKELRGDLDAIVMKALERDRAARYESVSALAADLERHLGGEPVGAAPQTTLYLLRKLVRRRRAAAFVAVTIAVLGAGGAVGIAEGYGSALRANADLDAGLDEKDAALRRETRERERAERDEASARAAEEAARQRADEAERVSEFRASQLADIDAEAMGAWIRRALLDPRLRTATDLDAADLDDDLGGDLDDDLAGVGFTNVALELLREGYFEQTLATIDRELRDQPSLQARLLQTMANTLSTLGLPDAAAAPQGRALALRRERFGDDDPRTLESLGRYGVFLLRGLGRIEDAAPVLADVLERRRRVLGDEHPDTLSSLDGLGTLRYEQGELEEAERLYREALDGRRRTLGDADRATLDSIAHVGTALAKQSRLADAEPFLREAVAGNRRILGDRHAVTLSSINSLGVLLLELGEDEEANALLTEALDGKRRALGDEHPATLAAIHAMGRLRWQRSEWTEAEALLREGLEGRRRVLGDLHPDTLRSVNAVGVLLDEMWRFAEADPYYDEVVTGRRRVLGDDHPATLAAISNLAAVRLRLGRLDEAEALAREAVAGRRRAFGDDHASTLSSLRGLGEVLQARGAVEDAEQVLREVLTRRRATLGDRHDDTLLSMGDLAAVLLERGEHEEAATLYREVVAAERRDLGDEHPSTLISVDNLAIVLDAAGEDAEAEARYREVLEGRRRVMPEGHPHILLSLERLAGFCERRGRLEEARSLYGEALAGRRWIAGGDPAAGAEASAGLVRVLSRIVDAARATGDPGLGASLLELGAHTIDRGEFEFAEASFLEAHAAAGDGSPGAADRRAATSALIDLYEIWDAEDPGAGHGAEAAAWRARLGSEDGP